MWLVLLILEQASSKSLQMADGKDAISELAKLTLTIVRVTTLFYGGYEG